MDAARSVILHANWVAGNTVIFNRDDDVQAESPLESGVEEKVTVIPAGLEIPRFFSIHGSWRVHALWAIEGVQAAFAVRRAQLRAHLCSLLVVGERIHRERLVVRQTECSTLIKSGLGTTP